MDFLSYRGLPMTILQSTVHERAPQEDKSHTTYETTRWLVSFLVTYNPGAISFVSPGAVAPIASAGSMPVSTDRQIREYLEEPRGQLIVRSSANPIFSQFQLINPAIDTNSLVILSPANGRRCDVRNGPFCKVNSIQHIAGERLWKIHLTFETYVTGSSAGQRRGLILNNRWSVASDINWQHLTTRVYQGICTVNANLLNDPTYNPGIAGYQTGVLDSIRQAFAGFSVPTGFQRTFVKVEMTPDGNNAAYVVRDEEQLYSKPGDFNVPRIEVHDSNWFQKMGWGAAVASQMNPVAAGVALAARERGMSTRAAMALAQPFMFGTTPFAVAAAQVPKMSRTVIVRIWGNQLKARGDLVSRGVAIAANRLGNIALFSVATGEIVVSGDSNNLVMVTWTTRWGRESAYGDFTSFLLNQGGITIGGTESAGSTSWVNSLGKKLFFNLPQNNSMTATPSSNPPFPSQRGTAGTATGLRIAPLITQVLEAFGASPGSVP